jgi:dTMP kinase
MNTELGRYVRIEGCDGAGKSTQIELAKQYNEEKGIGAVFVREPGGSEFGARIRALLLTDHSVKLGPEVEFALFTADRRHLWDETILPALNDNRPVISDRGVESTMCYQSAGGGIDKQTIMDVSTQLLPTRYMQPDALAVIAVSKEIRRQRLQARFTQIAADKIELRDEDYANRVYEAYQSLQDLDYATVIDGDKDPEEVFEHLKPVIFGRFAK